MPTHTLCNLGYTASESCGGARHSLGPTCLCRPAYYSCLIIAFYFYKRGGTLRRPAVHTTTFRLQDVGDILRRGIRGPFLSPHMVEYSTCSCCMCLYSETYGWVPQARQHLLTTHHNTTAVTVVVADTWRGSGLLPLILLTHVLPRFFLLPSDTTTYEPVVRCRTPPTVRSGTATPGSPRTTPRLRTTYTTCRATHLLPPTTCVAVAATLLHARFTVQCHHITAGLHLPSAPACHAFLFTYPSLPPAPPPLPALPITPITTHSALTTLPSRLDMTYTHTYHY